MEHRDRQELERGGGLMKMSVKRLKYQREWRKKNPGYTLKYYYLLKERDPKRWRAYQRKWDETTKKRILRYKVEVYKKYGNKCECCKEEIKIFLTFHHVNGKGKRWKTPRNKWMWLRNRPRKKYLKLMCFNCNCAIELLGYCPHRPNYKEK